MVRLYTTHWIFGSQNLINFEVIRACEAQQDMTAALHTRGVSSSNLLAGTKFLSADSASSRLKADRRSGFLPCLSPCGSGLSDRPGFAGVERLQKFGRHVIFIAKDVETARKRKTKRKTKLSTPDNSPVRAPTVRMGRGVLTLIWPVVSFTCLPLRQERWLGSCPRG